MIKTFFEAKIAFFSWKIQFSKNFKPFRSQKLLFLSKKKFTIENVTILKFWKLIQLFARYLKIFFTWNLNNNIQILIVRRCRVKVMFKFLRTHVMKKLSQNIMWKIFKIKNHSFLKKLLKIFSFYSNITE